MFKDRLTLLAKKTSLCKIIAIRNARCGQGCSERLKTAIC